MTSVDTEFSNEVLKASYSEAVKKLPTTEKINSGSNIKIVPDSEYMMDIDYRVPKKQFVEYLECYPSKFFFF